MKAAYFEGQRLRADAAGAVLSEPKWQMLFPRGTRYRPDYPGGKVTVDQAFLLSVRANFKKLGAPKKPIDYFHRGASDVPVPNSEKIAAGWIHDVEIRADGMWGLCSFTAAALSKIRAEELAYLSPEWRPDWIDAQTNERQGPTLIAAGLLNDPFFSDMPRVAASASAVPPANPPPASKAKEHRTMKNPIAAVAALAILGLNEDATEADVAAAGEKLKATNAETESIKASATSQLVPLKAQLEAESTARKALEETVKSLTASAAKADTEAKVAAAIASPELATRLTTPQLKESFRSIVASAGFDVAVKTAQQFPVQVQLGTVGHGKPVASDDTQATAFEKIKASAAVLEKAGVPAHEAMEAAMRADPTTAAIASSLFKGRS